MTSASSCRSMSTTPSARVPSRSCSLRQDPSVSRCAPISPARAPYPPTLDQDAHHLPGDGHYARPEAMEWCEANHIDYVFGLPGSKPLAKKIDEAADAVRTERALSNKPVVRGYAETRHKAKSWSRERHAVARIEATPLGLDTRFVVTNVDTARRNGFTPPSIARAGRPRTSSSCTRRSSLPIERPVVPRSQIRSASRCTRRLTGSCSPFATPSETARSSQRRVLDLATAADQDRRPRHRNRKPRPSRFRRRLPGGRPLPRPARSPRPARTLNGGARSPSAPRHPSNAFAKVSVVSGEKAERTRAPRGPKSRVATKSKIVVNRKG